jgi:Domain of Unknown Function (DUF928)
MQLPMQLPMQLSIPMTFTTRLIPVLVLVQFGLISAPIEAAVKRFRPPAVPDLGRTVGSLRGGASRGIAAKLCPEPPIQPAAIAPRFWATPGNSPGEPWQLVEGGAPKANPSVSKPASQPISKPISQPISQPSSVQPISLVTTVGNPLLTSREIVFGQTLNSRPKFWFYSPYSLDRSRSTQFRLGIVNPQTSRTEPLFANPLIVTTEKPGLFAVELPPGIELQTGKLYRWSLAIRCGSEPAVSMSGVISRLTLPTAPPKSAKDSQPELLYYLDNNLWYDAVNLAATDRRHWKSLMEMVELLDLADPRLFPN